MTHSKPVEVLPPPNMAEWIANHLAGNPSGETPQLIGPESLLDRIKFFRGNIANLEGQLCDELATGDYENAEVTCEDLKCEILCLVEILKDVHQVDEGVLADCTAETSEELYSSRRSMPIGEAEQEAAPSS